MPRARTGLSNREAVGDAREAAGVTARAVWPRGRLREEKTQLEAYQGGGSRRRQSAHSDTSPTAQLGHPKCATMTRGLLLLLLPGRRRRAETPHFKLLHGRPAPRGHRRRKTKRFQEQCETGSLTPLAWDARRAAERNTPPRRQRGAHLGEREDVLSGRRTGSRKSWKAGRVPASRQKHNNKALRHKPALTVAAPRTTRAATLPPPPTHTDGAPEQRQKHACSWPAS